jgi:hypothetical protein
MNLAQAQTIARSVAATHAALKAKIDVLGDPELSELEQAHHDALSAADVAAHKLAQEAGLIADDVDPVPLSGGTGKPSS